MTRERPANEVLDPGALPPLYQFASLAVAPFLVVLPIGVGLAFYAALLWRVAADRRPVWQPGRAVRILLTALTVYFVFRHFHTLLGRDAGLALLIVLLGLKFLELRTARDFVFSALLFFVVLAGRFLYDQALWVGVYALPVVVAGLAALVRVAQPTGLSGPQRWRVAAVLLLQAVPLMLALYFLFPRLHGTLWGLPMDSGHAVTGLSERMQPGSIQKLSESNEIAFRASFIGRPPGAAGRYWRELVLWRTDGRAWERGEPAGKVTESMTPAGDEIRYLVILEAGGPPFLPTLDLPATEPPGVLRRRGLVFEQRDVKRERYQYEMVSSARLRPGSLSTVERRAALQLPSVAISPRVQALADRWRSEHAGARAIAQAAFQFFRNEQFIYTLEPPLLGADPVDEFLFVTRRGFCEHYASAFVTLMRAAGVPARVVLGYQGGESGAAGNYLIVRQSDAHAWAEIWDDKAGWVRTDPTAAIAPERVELGNSALRRLAAQGIAPGNSVSEAVLRQALRLGLFDRLAFTGRLYWDYANLAWFRWVAGYTPEQQEKLVAALGFGKTSAARLAGLILVSAGLILSAYALWIWRRNRVRDPVQASYLRLCRKLARAGITHHPHEGALTFAARCARARPDLAESLNKIAALYVELRYGRAVSEAAQIKQLRDRVAAFRA